jgi:hypothetical protein
MGGSYSYSWTMNAVADKAGWAKFSDPFSTTLISGKSSYADLKMQFKNTGRYTDLSVPFEQSMTAWAEGCRVLCGKSHVPFISPLFSVISNVFIHFIF